MPAKAAVQSKSLELTRVFKAPIGRVWHAWSTEDALQTWWGPKGCKLTTHWLEFRPGGFFHYEMKFTNTPPWYGRFNYRDIADRERIVWLNSFANELGGIVRAPFAPEFPMEVLNTAHFTDHGGKTRVALTSTPFGALANEVAAFESIFDSMNKGYSAALDQLEEVLG